MSAVSVRREPKDPSVWKSVDWSLPTFAIAQQLNSVPFIVSRHRSIRAPWTTKRKHRVDRKSDWKGVDWTKSNNAIVREVGASDKTVIAARKSFAPEKLKKSPHAGATNPAWLSVDWSKTNGEIATEVGVTYRHASNMRSFRKKRLAATNHQS